jgi:hypothetical protein
LTEHPESVEAVAHQVRAASETADLSALSDVLDPNVRRGPPGDPSPPCQTRAGLVVDIVGFDQRSETVAHAEVADE